MAYDFNTCVPYVFARGEIIPIQRGVSPPSASTSIPTESRQLASRPRATNQHLNGEPSVGVSAPMPLPKGVTDLGNQLSQLKTPDIDP